MRNLTGFEATILNAQIARAVSISDVTRIACGYRIATRSEVTFTEEDLAWFRKPVGSVGGGL